MRWAYTIALATAIALGQPAGRGAISGTATEGSTGNPIRKAIVTVTLQGTPQCWATARTDSQGQFKFESLPPGKYDLRATKAEMGTATYGADGPAEIGELISLAEGETRAGLQLRFVRAAVISGRVFEPDGDPVAGVTISLLRAGRNLGKRVLVNYRVGSTDDRGSYRIANLDVGDYYLQADPSNVIGPVGFDPPASSEIFTAQYYGGVRNWKDSTVLHIRSGENLADLDFHLNAEQPHQIRGRITGVPDLGPPPAPDPSKISMSRSAGSVEVDIGPTDEGAAQWGGGSAAEPPDYRFEIGAFPAGAYRVEARMKVGNKLWAASQLVELPVAADEVVLALSPALDIQGQLKIEGETSPANSNFQVTVAPQGSRRGMISGRIGPDGRFTLPQVPPGEWVMNVPSIPTGAFLKSAYLGDKDVRFAPFSIGSDSKAQLNIVISTRSATIEGEVDARAGDSKRAGVVLAPTGAFHTLLRFYYGAVTDDSGKFRLANIAPGKYKLFALEKMAPLGFRNPESAHQLDELGTEVELTEGATLTVHPKLIPMTRARAALGPEVPK
jgi:hypothetical protein